MKEAIEKLFTVTSTPKSLTHESAKLIESLIPSLVAIHPDKVEARALVVFCVNILNSKNLKSLSKAQQVLKPIIQPILDEVPSEEVSGILNIINAIGVEIERHDSNQFFKLSPKELDNPLLRFHLKSHRFPAYPLLALTCHRLLRSAEAALDMSVAKKELPWQKAGKKLESVVAPFVHLVHFYKIDASPNAYVTDLPPGKIKEALQLGQHEDSVRYADDSTTESYLRIVLSVMDGYFPVFRERKEIVCDWGYQRIFGKRFIQEKVYEEGLSYKEWITLNNNAEAESEEGGYPLEEGEIEEDEPSNDDIARRMLLSQIRPSQFPCFYQRQSISLNDYSRIFHGLLLQKDLNDMTTDNLAVALSFLALIFYGFNPKKYAKIKIRRFADGNETILSGDLFYEPDRSLIYYRMEEDQVANIYNSTEPKDSGIYRTSGSLVELPVHGIFKNVAEALSKRARAERSRSIQKFRKIINSHLAAYKSTISPFSFHRSFLNYAISRYNLDPLVAAYISCSAPREQRAQKYYTSVSAERIRDDAASFQECLLKDILANCEKLGLPVRKELFHPETVSSCEPSSEFIGSGFVPNDAELKVVIAQIKTLLVSGAIKDPKRYFNVYTFYTMLLLRFTTGLRQIEVERMKDKDLDREGRLLSVHGKGNRLYNEYRLIPLLPMTIHAIEELKRAQKEYYWWLIGRGELAPVDIEQRPAYQNLFYLVNEMGLPIPASSSSIRELLKAENEGFFPFKLNASRHLVRTRLFEMKVPHQLLNVYIGHQTKGKEFLSHFSLSLSCDIKEKIMPQMEKLANELDLSVIPYKGKKDP